MQVIKIKIKSSLSNTYNRMKHIELLRRLWFKQDEKALQEILKYCDNLMPYSKLPNVKKYEITELGLWHPVLESFGVWKRLTNPEVTKSNHRNGNLNKYLKHMFKNLNKHRTNWRVF